MVAVAHMSEQHASGARPRTGRDRERTQRMLQNLPIAGLGVVACLAVGYGLGTLVQFDRDWRSESTVLVASVDGPAPAGASLADSIDAVLRAGETEVSSVMCLESEAAAGQGRLCRGQGEAGMVSIVATQSADLLHVDVFAAR